MSMQAKTTITPHHVKVQLILTDNCRDCLQAKAMWLGVCEEYGCDFEVLDIEQDAEASQLVDILELVAFPALLIDGHVRAVGKLNERQAHALLDRK